MDKTAQSKWQTGYSKKNPFSLNRLRELANVPAEKLTGFFKPEHERVMNALRQLDDRVRAEITGTTIGEFSPATGIKQSAKDLLKSARKNFARNEFMTGISELAAFHQKMFEIVKEINKFQIDVNKIHHKFLFEGMDEDKVNRMRAHMERKADLQMAELMTKEAGVMDFFHNLLSPRGRALSAWVKKYPKETKELREGGAKLVEQGQALFDSTLAILKNMGTARATRRPDEYMDQANKLKAEFAKFDGGDKGFTHYYHNVVMPFIKNKDEMDKLQKEQAAKAKTEEMPAPSGGRTELGEEGPPTVPGMPTPSVPAPSAPAAPVTVNQPPVPAAFNQPPGASPPFAPQPRQSVQTVQPPDEAAPDTEKDPATLRGLGAHQRFMESLESMSGEDPRILAGYISKYAKSIQARDPKTAIELFSIVRQLRS